MELILIMLSFLCVQLYTQNKLKDKTINLIISDLVDADEAKREKIKKCYEAIIKIHEI